VLAAAAGVVLYAGELAGRGVISIQHGDVRTTYEPTDPVVRAGDVVAQGQLIGSVSSAADGCGPAGGCLHWGAIRGGTYVDPMSLLASAQSRAIRLLPIWGPEAVPDAGTPRVAAPRDTRPATAAAATGTAAATAASGTATAATEATGTAATGAGRASPAVRAARAVTVAGAVALTVTMGRVRRRSARRASRATAAQPWYASGRSGFR
jgi:pyruvate/2-oxoglutarate dehydrogenase complex dihydrolipoamide acyltransferase (E2) component